MNELGLIGFQDGPARTGIGLAATLPRTNRSNTYQLQETIALVRGPHSLKFGADLSRHDTALLFAATLRGRLVYNTLQNLVDDFAQQLAINPPLPGGSPWYHYRYSDHGFFAQDQWRILRSLSLTYGFRYELPRNPADDLRRNNQPIVDAAGGDPRFAVSALPARDLRDWAPRFGFAYKLDQSGRTDLVTNFRMRDGWAGSSAKTSQFCAVVMQGHMTTSLMPRSSARINSGHFRL